MTVYQSSRYVSAPIAKPPGSIKPISKVAPAPVPTLFPKRPTRRNTTPAAHMYSERVVVQGDRFDLLAGTLLGNPKHWWMLADINPEVFFPFDDLLPGSVIRIPSSATAAFTVVSQTFVPQLFNRVFDGQNVPQ